MHRARLALIAIAAVAFPGAAPAPSPLNPLAECRVPRGQAADLLAAVPVQEVQPSDEGGDITYYEVPSDLRVFGYHPTMLAMSVSQRRGSEHMQVLTVVERPFAEVEPRMLAGHGLDTCPDRSGSDAPVCSFSLRLADGGSALMVLQEFEDGAVGINCAYTVPRSK